MRSAAIVLVVLAFTLSCLAQDNSTRAIHGTVFYPSIRRIADANVALVNSATGFRYEQFTNSQGQFAIELLPRANTPRVKPPRDPLSRPTNMPSRFFRDIRIPWSIALPLATSCSVPTNLLPFASRSIFRLAHNFAFRKFTRSAPRGNPKSQTASSPKFPIRSFMARN